MRNWKNLLNHLWRKKWKQNWQCGHYRNLLKYFKLHRHWRTKLWNMILRRNRALKSPIWSLKDYNFCSNIDELKIKSTNSHYNVLSKGFCKNNLQLPRIPYHWHHVLLTSHHQHRSMIQDHPKQMILFLTYCQKVNSSPNATSQNLHHTPHLLSSHRHFIISHHKKNDE